MHPWPQRGQEIEIMSDYRLDEHRVNNVDVAGSWIIAAVVVAALFVLILPFGLLG